MSTEVVCNCYQAKGGRVGRRGGLADASREVILSYTQSASTVSIDFEKLRAAIEASWSQEVASKVSSHETASQPRKAWFPDDQVHLASAGDDLLKHLESLCASGTTLSSLHMRPLHDMLTKWKQLQLREGVDEVTVSLLASTAEEVAWNYSNKSSHPHIDFRQLKPAIEDAWSHQFFDTVSSKRAGLPTRNPWCPEEYGKVSIAGEELLTELEAVYSSGTALSDRKSCNALLKKWKKRQLVSGEGIDDITALLISGLADIAEDVIRGQSGLNATGSFGLLRPAIEDAWSRLVASKVSSRHVAGVAALKPAVENAWSQQLSNDSSLEHAPELPGKVSNAEGTWCQKISDSRLRRHLDDLDILVEDLDTELREAKDPPKLVYSGQVKHQQEPPLQQADEDRSGRNKAYGGWKVEPSSSSSFSTTGAVELLPTAVPPARLPASRLAGRGETAVSADEPSVGLGGSGRASNCKLSSHASWLFAPSLEDTDCVGGPVAVGVGASADSPAAGSMFVGSSKVRTRQREKAKRSQRARIQWDSIGEAESNLAEQDPSSLKGQNPLAMTIWVDSGSSGRIGMPPPARSDIQQAWGDSPAANNADNIPSRRCGRASGTGQLGDGAVSLRSSATSACEQPGPPKVDLGTPTGQLVATSAPGALNVQDPSHGFPPQHIAPSPGAPMRWAEHLSHGLDPRHASASPKPSMRWTEDFSDGLAKQQGSSSLEPSMQWAEVLSHRLAPQHVSSSLEPHVRSADDLSHGLTPQHASASLEPQMRWAEDFYHGLSPRHVSASLDPSMRWAEASSHGLGQQHAFASRETPVRWAEDISHGPAPRHASASPEPLMRWAGDTSHGLAPEHGLASPDPFMHRTERSFCSYGLAHKPVSASSETLMHLAEDVYHGLPPQSAFASPGSPVRRAEKSHQSLAQPHYSASPESSMRLVEKFANASAPGHAFASPDPPMCHDEVFCRGSGARRAFASPEPPGRNADYLSHGLAPRHASASAEPPVHLATNFRHGRAPRHTSAPPEPSMHWAERVRQPDKKSRKVPRQTNVLRFAGAANAYGGRER
eukprot:TRINITY_DN20825_c0_g1_i1.p1 TRINITY_DN20825_c0_g1~~TRINITY_DN20825_c0_g1_i1.p1  ORF type:complete len:1058 (+),score=163.06 TRINITY_DN20825_c0_g1_i1:439-3612(+)